MIKLTRIYNKRFSQSKATESLRNLNNFKFLSSNFSQDFNIQINQLIHVPTGAKIYNLHNNDIDNTFATIFKTFPSDSKGCPHILQHLACCGSKKYPIRDPFFNMLKRSVNTYMNAWTGQDFTCYPFSSANTKDWRNLFSVYTDMSFRPLLNELDFMQEGWRYEIDEKGEKQIKGIVYNEMKGSYQGADRQLMMALNEGLFGGTGYRFDSGGKPEQIINLSYSQLIDMHKHFYHPSNMSLFFYGNQNIAENLKSLDQEYLKNYQYDSKYNHNQPIQPHLPKQKFKTIISKTAQTNSISLFFYLKNIEQCNPVQGLALRVLQFLTLQKNTSYVYQHFIQTGIAQNIGYGGYNQSKLSTFGVTLKGVQKQYQCQNYYNDILKIFDKITSQGVNEKRLNQFLHELQIGIKTPKQNYGIKLLGDCLNLMNHRLQLINHMSPIKHINKVKQILLNKEKLREFITKHFIQNQHFIVVKQLTDESQASQDIQTKKIESSIQFSEEEIKRNQQNLKKRQATTQDANILPKLKLEDLVPRKKILPTLIQNCLKNQRNLKYFHIPIQNQIHFYRFVFNFKNIPFNINDKLTLWNSLINKGISTKKYNYKELTSRLGQFTAGFHVSTAFGTKDSVNIVFHISCLKRNKNQLLQIMQQILFDPVFQQENIKNLYRSFQNETIEGLTDTPISECIDQCGSYLSLQSRLFNKYQKSKEGLIQIREQNIQSLKQINKVLLECDSVILIQHSNEKAQKLPSFFQRFESQRTTKYLKQNFAKSYTSKAITHNFDVNFCTQQYQGPNYLSKQHAQLCILTQYLQQQYLHPQIREKGGAYGARSSVRQSGNICLFSYMDPQSTKTFQVFDQSVKKITSLDNLDQQKLQQIKITLIGQMQRIKVPQDQSLGPILKGYSIQDYQKFLLLIKQADSASILNTGRNYLDSNKKARCVFGKQVPQGFIEEKLSEFI